MIITIEQWTMSIEVIVVIVTRKFSDGSTARAFSAQRCTVRAQRSALGAWLRSARVPCEALCCPAHRGTAQRGERAGKHRERARAAPRVPAP